MEESSKCLELRAPLAERSAVNGDAARNQSVKQHIEFLPSTRYVTLCYDVIHNHCPSMSGSPIWGQKTSSVLLPLKHVNITVISMIDVLSYEVQMTGSTLVLSMLSVTMSVAILNDKQLTPVCLPTLFMIRIEVWVVAQLCLYFHNMFYIGMLQ